MPKLRVMPKLCKKCRALIYKEDGSPVLNVKEKVPCFDAMYQALQILGRASLDVSRESEQPWDRADNINMVLVNASHYLRYGQEEHTKERKRQGGSSVAKLVDLYILEGRIKPRY